MQKVLTTRFHALVGWCLIVLLNLFAQQAYAVNPGGNNTQSVHFTAIATQTLGNAPFAVSATATTGYAITSYSSLTYSICTVSGNTVTLINAGSCELSAYQAGNSIWLPATGTVTFTVLPGSQTITFGALGNQTYLNPNFTVSATSTAGLGVSFAASPSNVCNMASATTVSIAGTGTCSITATQGGSANYNAATPVVQSFAVNSAAQSITFGALPSLTYGAAPFTVSASSTSGLAVTAFSSATPSICTVSGSTVSIVGAGSCLLYANQAGNANYSAAPQVAGSFSVAPKSQSITFGALPTPTFGAAPFTVSATSTSGLAVTAFSSATTSVCTVSGSTVSIVVARTCRVHHQIIIYIPTHQTCA